MTKHSYRIEGVCPTKVDFDLDGNIIRNVKFERGCNGNLKAVASLVDGLTVDELEAKCGGIICGRRNTSCADQLVKAARRAYVGNYECSSNS